MQTYVMEYDQEIIEAILREISRNGQVFYLFNDTRRIMEKTSALEKLLPGARIVYAHTAKWARNSWRKLSVLLLPMKRISWFVQRSSNRYRYAECQYHYCRRRRPARPVAALPAAGQVGRSNRQAFAYVTYKRDKVLTEIAKRLTAIRDFTGAPALKSPCGILRFAAREIYSAPNSMGILMRSAMISIAGCWKKPSRSCRAKSRRSR